MSYEMLSGDNSDEGLSLAIMNDSSRLAVLESQCRVTRKEVRELRGEIESLQTSVDRMIQEIERYKGFIGEMVLIVSVLWAGLAFFREAFAGWLQR